MEGKKRIIRNHYEPLLSKYFDNFRIQDWESPELQIQRFSILKDNVNLSGKSLLDVGCGLGDLYGFLQETGVDADYSGIDILEPMVSRAKNIYPQGRFYTGDIFYKSFFSTKQFDVIFCSGIFNLNLGNNETFLHEALPVLFDLAKEYVVFNLLDTENNSLSHKYFFYNRKEVIHLVRKYTAAVDCITDYIPYDFTIVAKI